MATILEMNGYSTMVAHDGRVLVLTRNSGRGKVSGLDLDEVSTRGANLVTVREGLVTRIDAYWDRANAFRDLGLNPR